MGARFTTSSLRLDGCPHSVAAQFIWFIPQQTTQGHDMPRRNTFKYQVDASGNRAAELPPPRTAGIWTEGNVETLKRLWDQGWSCGQISMSQQMIGCFSRNAVFGKIHRMGLPARATAVRKKIVRRCSNVPKSYHQSGKAQHQNKRALHELHPPRKVLTTDAGYYATVESWQTASKTLVAIPELDDCHCRWPIGDPKVIGCCGAEKVPGLSYCQGHARVAFAPVVRQPFVAKPKRSLQNIKAVEEFLA
jgi:GcrA cell cycle regulator